MNQTPEQLARDRIDKQLTASGWLIQLYKQKNVAAGLGVAIREYQSKTSPAHYNFFCESKTCWDH